MVSVTQQTVKRQVHLHCCHPSSLVSWFCVFHNPPKGSPSSSWAAGLLQAPQTAGQGVRQGLLQWGMEEAWFSRSFLKWHGKGTISSKVKDSPSCSQKKIAGESFLAGFEWRSSLEWSLGNNLINQNGQRVLKHSPSSWNPLHQNIAKPFYKTQQKLPHDTRQT